MPTPVSALIHSATMKFSTRSKSSPKSPKHPVIAIKPDRKTTDLVPWGLYLQGWHYWYPAHWRHIPPYIVDTLRFTPYQRSAFWGLLVGDGWLRARRNKVGITASFAFSQSIVNYPFLFHTWTLFRAFLYSPCSTFAGPNQKKAGTFSIRWRTHSFFGRVK